MTVVEPAVTISNVSEPELAVWFASPAYVYEALAVPTFVLFAYVGSGVRWRLPAPVTVTEHGSRAEPVYTALGGQVTTVEEPAWAMSIETSPESET